MAGIGYVMVSTYTASATPGASTIAGTFVFTGSTSSGLVKSVSEGKLNLPF